jgi:hypothetical protein
MIFFVVESRIRPIFWCSYFMQRIFPTRDESRGHTGLDPPFKQLHSLWGPRPIAWHRTVLHMLQDVRRMSAHVVEGPKIKRLFHGLPVMFPE